ncbi:MAG: hypothetical protein N3A72_00290 [bacterium]|nr:hypothetical protein [bacterium]
MANPKLKWIVFIIAVFLIGDVLGFLSGQVYQRYEMEQRRRGRGGPPPRPQNFITDLKQQLNLTPEQVNKIENILEANRKRIEQELAPFREKANSIRKEVETQIESVLTPEQKVKYKQFRDKMEMERKKFEMERRQRLGNDTTRRFLPPPSRDFLPPPPR